MAQESIYGHVRTYGRDLEHLLVHTYGQRSCTRLGRNGETASSSCSWGANRLGRNGMRRRVHREGLDGTSDGNEAWRTAERRGLVFDRPRSKWDPVHREGSGVPQNGGKGPPTIETGVLLIGRGVAYRKMDETDLCWSATVETEIGRAHV